MHLREKRKKILRSRKFYAGTLSLLLIGSAILIIMGKQRDFSFAFNPAPQIIELSTDITPFSSNQEILNSAKIPQPKFQLQTEPPQTSRKESKFKLSSGDIIGQNTGGRPTAPDGSTLYGNDQRTWVDARFPLYESTMLKIYGAGTLGWETPSLEETHDIFLRENISYGTGFGISWKLNENTEFLLDYRLTLPADTNRSNYERTNTTGFSIKISF